MGGDYFPELYNWLRNGGYAAVTGFLSRYQIPVAMNPALEFGGMCQRAPKTSSTAAAITETMGPIEQSILEAIAEGRQGFRGDWVSSIMLNKFLKETGRAKILSAKRCETVLQTLGYVKHFALPDGRSSRAIMSEENRKPILYVRAGSISQLNITKPVQVVEAYTNAQGYGMESGSLDLNTIASVGDD